MLQPSRPPSETPEDIAIIGLGCLFPGAPDIATYWRNIVGKVSAITDPPPEAWDPATYYEAGARTNDRVYCRKGGYLGPLAFFNPLDHGIMPRAVEGGEPDQWLALKVARDALVDAGYPDGVPERERAALVLGKGTYANRGTISVVYHAIVVDYTLQLLRSIHPGLTADDLRRIREDLKRHLPRFDAETAPALISNVTVGRIANRLDLMGPSYTIDAACASSLVAVDTAVKGLRNREFDLALVGGMQVATPVPVLGLFCQLNALSPSETIRPFDEHADGTLLSEGIGIAVLKRRAEAERDGNRIYAVVKSAGVASDGRAVSVLAPRVEGEELALRRAYDGAGIAPRSVGLIEAHGTATLAGDAVEVEALRRVFGERRGPPHCALGSVKSMIGHTMPAAGMAGLIKAALALYHKTLPPTIGVATPNPRLKLETTPFYLNTETRPWVHGATAHPRRAGVNAFGFGGINAHVVLEEAPEPDAYEAHEWRRESELCVFAGSSREDVIARMGEVLQVVSRDPDLALAEIAFALHRRDAEPASREAVVAVVATSTDDLVRKLGRAQSRLRDASCRRIKDVAGIFFFADPLARTGRLAYLFPGEGAQYLNMLADLCRYFPEVRAAFDDMDARFADDPRGYVISQIVFPPPVFSTAERLQAERRLFEMDAAVEAVYTANIGMHALLAAFAVRPDAIVGHSTGEYAAMRAAGMLKERGYEVHELDRIYRSALAGGRMPEPVCLVAVGAARERVEPVRAAFGDAVCVAMDNCRHQVVLVAREGVARDLQASLEAAGLLYELLDFDRPYHTPAFEPYAREMRGILSGLVAHPARVPLYSTTSAKVFPQDVEGARTLAYEHWVRPVEFRRTIEGMYDDGVRIFLEAGPRGNLTAFVDDILAGRSYAAIPANVTRRPALTQLQLALGQLVAHGVALDLAPLYARRRLRVIDLAAHAASPPKPALGSVKIPTGAPEMKLSPELCALVRSRAAQASMPAAGDAQRKPDSALAPLPVEPPADPRPSNRPRDAASRAAAPTTATGDAIRRGETALVRDGAMPAGEADTPAPLAASAAPPADSPGADSGGASRVMSSYFDTMQRFLEMQLRAVHGAGAAPTVTGSVTRWPAFIDEVVDHQPGNSLVARCSLDLDRHPCLRDHALGRNVSAADPDLPAFVVVPFTLMAEIMAEAASLLAAEAVLTRMRDVRTLRWLSLDRGPASVEVRATVVAPGEIAVRLVELQGGAGALVAEGVMTFADGYAPAPHAHGIDLPDGRAYRWPAGHLYDEAMFHGPAFQGVRSVDRVGSAGAVASLQVCSRDRLVRDAHASRLVTDFVLLDLPGQVVGFWASHVFDRGYLVLPFQLRSLEIFGPLLAAGEPLTCTVAVAPVGEQRIIATMEVVRSDGTVWARFEGWEDRRFDVPPAALRMMVQPEAVSHSSPWPLARLPAAKRLTPRRLGPEGLASDWLQFHGGLWTRVLAMLVLGRRERVLWHALTGPDLRRMQWLRGRIVAKEAIRDYVHERTGLLLRPADIEIIPDALGMPVVHGDWLRRLPCPLSVSISHVEDVAVAVVGDWDEGLAVGIDLERVGRMSAAAAGVAFTERELEMLPLLDRLDSAARGTWALRLWCAKEACAKAVGRGFSDGLRAFTLSEVDADSGTFRIRFDAPGGTSMELAATTVQDGEWVVAICVTGVREDVRA